MYEIQRRPVGPMHNDSKTRPTDICPAENRDDLCQIYKRNSIALLPLRLLRFRSTRRSQAKLLQLLCEHKNNVVSREMALNNIWGDNNYFTTRSMDVFITKLRKRLKSDSSIEIINVHGNGFRLLAK